MQKKIFQIIGIAIVASLSPMADLHANENAPRFKELRACQKECETQHQKRRVYWCPKYMEEFKKFGEPKSVKAHCDTLTMAIQDACISFCNNIYVDVYESEQ